MKIFKVKNICPILLLGSFTSVSALAAPGYNEGGSLPTLSSKTINAANNGVIANDGLDDTQALQAIIDNIDINNSPTNRITIKLPVGVINLYDEVHVDRSGIIIEGAGKDSATGTSIVINSWAPYNEASDGAPDFDKKYWPGFGAFRVETRLMHANEQAYEGSINYHWKHGIEFDKAAAKGETILHLERRAAKSFNVGDLIYVGAANDDAFLDLGAVPQAQRSNGHIKVGHMRTQIFKVTGTDEDNDTVTIDKPLEFNIPITNNSGKYKSRVMPVTAVEDVGFRNFHITMENAGTGCAGLNNNEYDTDPNGVNHRYQNMCPKDAIHGLIFKWAYNGWVDNVSLEMLGSHPIVTEFAKNMTFSNNKINGSWNKGAGGNGYFRGSKLYNSWIINNDIKNVRHLTLQWSATGNLVENNSLNADINLHGGWERNNTIRNNIVKVPFAHRSWTNGAPGTGTWQPIWYASGDHASKWAGPTGPHNVFLNNTLAKELAAGEGIQPWGLFDKPNQEYIFGWDGKGFKHLNVDGVPVASWSQDIAVKVHAQMPQSGVMGDEMPIIDPDDTDIPDTDIPITALYAKGDTINAINFDKAIGSVTNSTVVGYINKGDGMVYPQVAFDDIEAITLRVSGIRAGHLVEIRRGSQTGTLLGSFITTSTGAWNNYEDRNISFNSTEVGIDNLVVYVNASTGGSGGVMNLDTITLSGTPAAAPDDTITPDDPETPNSGTCHDYSGKGKQEIDLSGSHCVVFSEGLSNKTVQFWDSDEHSSCNFRGSITSDKSGSVTVSSNYLASSNFTGKKLTLTSSNDCQYIKIRAY